MKFSTIAVAIGAVAAAALFAGGPYAFRQWVQSRARAERDRASQRHAELHPQAAALPAAPPFSRVQAVGFLETAQAAEAIKDPLARCLAYPDPPGSHWNRAAVRAYCHYRYQPVLGMQEIRRLVQDGRAAQLDRLLAAALKAQETDPDARGRLDRIYESDFRDASPAARQIIDAWKREDPRSAFAHAASGVAYVAAADAVQKGGRPYADSAGKAMPFDSLVWRARLDLQRALALNPHLAPAYRAMIHLGGMALGSAYALDAVKRGMREAPDDLGLFDAWMWLVEQYDWDGSPQAMDEVSLQAADRVVANPLLALEPALPGVYRALRCSCTVAQRAAAYQAMAKEFLGYGDLEHAGDAAKANNDPAGMAIFYSEALRFNDADQGARSGRSFVLAYYDFRKWAIDDADRALGEDPGDAYALVARGFARAKLQDWPAATGDFKAAVAHDPQNPWVLQFLGRAYLSTCQWDAAWEVADKLVKLDPAGAQGWGDRAVVQVYQPRPGLADTAAYLKAHFAHDPEVKPQLTRLESIVTWHASQRAAAAKRHGPAQFPPLLPPWYRQCHAYDGMHLRRPRPAMTLVPAPVQR